MGVLSKRKVVFTIRPGMDSQMVLQQLLAFNSDHPESPPFVAMWDHAGRRIFRAVSRRTARQVAAAQRPSGAPDPTPYEIIMKIKGCPLHKLRAVVPDFLARAVAYLRQHDSAFPDVTVTPWYFMERGQDTGRVMLTGLALNEARVFYYEFRGFVWSTGDGAQHMELDLSNPAFEEELKDWSTRQAASSPAPLPMALSDYMTVHGRLPAGNLPAAPAQQTPSASST